MVRDDYSYWLSIETADRKPLSDADRHGLEAVCKSYDGIPFFPSADPEPYQVLMEVDPDSGTCPEDEGITKVLAEWSKTLGKGFIIRLHAIDEEDKSKEMHLVYRGGACLREAYGRTVPADRNWDGHTLDDVIAFVRGYLTGAGDDLIAAIRARFAEPDWNSVDWDSYVDRYPVE